MMHILTQVVSVKDYHRLKRSAWDELILAPFDLNRFGNLSWADTLEILAQHDPKEPPLHLQCDLTVCERDMATISERMLELPLERVHAFRLADLGLARWCSRRLPGRPLHLLLENGFRNLAALQTIAETFGPTLERLVISPEIPESTLLSWLGKSPLPMERLLLGPLLLFSTPRLLLSPRLGPAPHLAAWATSSDKGLKGPYRVIENKFGTFFFYPRDIGILPHAGTLALAGLAAARVDRFFTGENELPEGIPAALHSDSQVVLESIQTSWPHRVFEGFYRANRSDTVFPRLKNQALQQRDTGCLAEVLESRKHGKITLRARQQMLAGVPLEFVLPTGAIIPVTPQNFQMLSAATCLEAAPGDLVQIPHVKFVVPGTLLRAVPTH